MRLQNVDFKKIKKKVLQNDAPPVPPLNMHPQGETSKEEISWSDWFLVKIALALPAAAFDTSWDTQNHRHFSSRIHHKNKTNFSIPC
jgi:hypothetical protein